MKNSKKKVKLHCLLQECNLTPEELIENPNQKQYTEVLCQDKIKDQVIDFYAKLYYQKPTGPDKDEILRHIGAENVNTITQNELEDTEKSLSMAEIGFCLKKTKNNIVPGSLGFTGAFIKPFGQY